MIPLIFTPQTNKQPVLIRELSVVYWSDFFTYGIFKGLFCTAFVSLSHEKQLDIREDIVVAPKSVLILDVSFAKKLTL